MRTHLFIILACFIFVGNNLHAQDMTGESPSVKVVGRVDANQVKLRWAITSSSAWLKANRYGYIIERFTIKRDGKQLDTAEKKVLTPTPILPKPLADWESSVQNNDYAAILAQALYGETFAVEEMQGGLAQIINKSKEIEQRFSFALFAADLNFEAAKLGGLGYVDTDIKENEDYFYTVKTAIPTELLTVKEGNVFVETTNKEELPQPIDLIAIGDDKNILLTWEYEMFKTVFTSYYLERSENGTDFTRLGDTPLVNLNDKPETPAKRMFYVDTLSQNDKTYYYRVKGISPFGEESPPSKVVSAQGVKKLSAVPHISRHKFDLSGGVHITWEFLKEAEKEITGFELNWAAQEKGPYTVVKTDIPAHTREVTYPEPEPSNYFRVTAIGKNNQKTTSLTAFVQTIDSIPPAMPVGLTGTVDTLGIVKLQWSANTEKDMLGYRVFRGNLKNEEASQLTVSPIAQTTFRDTVQIKSLNSNVFYQIVAVDQRFNMSEYSAQLALKKPDVVPPSSPVFKTYKVHQEGVSLTWINSSSDDVKYHKLYRQLVTQADKGWQAIYQTDTISTYTDHTVKTGQKYRYAIFAEDESGLTSLPSTPISVTVQKNKPTQVIKNFSGFADRAGYKIDLSWKIINDKVLEVLIYRNEEGEPPTLWRQLPGDIQKIEDTSVSPNIKYTYQLKAILKNSGYSTIETVNIMF
jgi:fibronectin type 3 domain-containing protein